MIIRLAIFVIAMLCGCVSQTTPAPVSTVAALTPPAPVAIARKAVVKSVVSPVTVHIPFIYPPDASNHLWGEEMSTNLTDWVLVTQGMPWPENGVLTNNTFTVQAILPCAFFRMVETTN